MELRDLAEQILFADTLEDKLECPEIITDERPGLPLPAPNMPGRPAELRFKPGRTGKAAFPGLFSLDQPGQRGRLLHFFANHELLATELMALVLLRFPQAQAAFRRGVLQTLKDEQEHTRLYLRRMRACGITFGELPVSGYFWRAISSMESPLDYLAGLSLTFEQANLDFTRFFARGFAQVDDTETSGLLDRIYHDEIGHVACGLKWFRKWKDPRQSDWEAFCRQLKFPMSAQRAKGPEFNVEGRLAAGLDRQFVDELQAYAQSKGRAPGIFVFNPFTEGRIAQGKSFTPNKHQQSLQEDLENLPQFLCRQDDVVLVGQRPSAAFLNVLKNAGYVVPEFVELRARRIDAANRLCLRKLGKLSPWAWGPDTLELFGPLFPNVTLGSRHPEDYYNERVAKLYSKEWSAELLRKVLSRYRGGNAERATLSGSRESIPGSGLESWLCTELEVGVAASTITEVMAQIESIRRRGHHNLAIKEAIGVAGHNAIRLLEPELLESQRRWILSAVENGRRVIVEPWLQRQVDFSVQLEMKLSGLKLVGYTGLLNDSKGQFRGNWTWPGFTRRICLDLQRLFPRIPDISRKVLSLYSEIVLVLEEELRKARYLGPLGIDAFVYRTPEGECRLKPIVEINPRYTMGRLTLELMKNVAPGRAGTFRLINCKIVKSDGFDNFPSWARVASERFPLRLEGEPIPKLTEGIVCLNDPERARVCMAVFEVGLARDSAIPG
jgi:uncharacterized ferritin-like protein (DUF455 family)